MPFAMRRSGRISGTSALALVGALCTLLLASHARAQQPEIVGTSSRINSDYLELEHIPSAQLPPADLALLRAKQRAIAAEAAFFGYDLAAGPGNDNTWSYEQSACPLLPDWLLLHYRRQFRDGAQSLFTALVPRGAGRIWVVPVLYRNATPFRSATGSERSIAVFNRIVPAAVAVKAIDPTGKWLSFALCYADIVYGNANILVHPGTEVGLSHAPMPLLRLSESTSLRGIVFTDRNAPGEYLVWSLTLNPAGRILSATAQQLSDYVAKIRNGAEPTEKPAPAGVEPPVKVLPPPKEPTVQTRPQ